MAMPSSRPKQPNLGVNTSVSTNQSRVSFNSSQKPVATAQTLAPTSGTSKARAAATRPPNKKRHREEDDDLSYSSEDDSGPDGAPHAQQQAGEGNRGTNRLYVPLIRRSTRHQEDRFLKGGFGASATTVVIARRCDPLTSGWYMYLSGQRASLSVGY